MDLRYARFQTFRLIRQHFSPQARRRRMDQFVKIAGVRDGMRIIDLGGSPEIWSSVACRLDITILNLPGIVERSESSHHRFTYIEGDACRGEMFRDGEFDLVFSNSVIEHVGSIENQLAFAQQVRRLAASYWVQTPSIWFPLEAHTGVPFWWFLPDAARQALIRRWRAKLPGWSRMVETTRVIRRETLIDLFPNSELIVETSFGLPKSYIVYHIASSPKSTSPSQ